MDLTVLLLVFTVLNSHIYFGDQVEFKWIRLGLAAKWEKAVEPALRLATVQGSFIIFSVVIDDVVGDGCSVCDGTCMSV